MLKRAWTFSWLLYLFVTAKGLKFESFFNAFTVFYAVFQVFQKYFLKKLGHKLTETDRNGHNFGHNFWQKNDSFITLKITKYRKFLIMKSKFYIRKGKQKITINFEYRNEFFRYRSSTPFQINDAKSWDNKRTKIKIPSNQPNASDINDKLELILSKFDKYLIENNLFNDITMSECKKLYIRILNEVLGVDKSDKVKKTSENKKEYDVISYFDFYIENFTKVPCLSTKKLIKKDSMKSYQSTKNKLLEFMKQKGISQLNFDDINRTFYYDFLTFLFEKDHCTNYIGTMIQKIKTIMKSSLEFEYHTNVEFQKNYFSKFRETINHPYLNENELKLITDLELEDELDSIARDIFIIQCHSGFRIQDLLDFIRNPKYSESNTGKRLFHFEQNKTDGEVFVPLNKKIRAILDKRNGELPPYISKSEINKRIKDICRKAGITSPYTLKRTVGGNQIDITKPKCEFICTHSARRSFCTNAYMKNIPPNVIMQISGHKTENTFMTYIKADLKLKAEKFSEYEYFQ